MIGRDKVISNYQEDNYYYWKAIAAEVKNHIIKEEAQIDKDPLQRENTKNMPEGSYQKECKII